MSEISNIHFFPRTSHEIKNFIKIHNDNCFISDVINYKTRIYKMWKSGIINKSLCEQELTKCNFFFASIFGMDSERGKIKQFAGSIPLLRFRYEDDCIRAFYKNRCVYNTIYSLSMWKSNKNFSGVFFHEDDYTTLDSSTRSIILSLSCKYKKIDC